ncbi:hypothetical protein Q5P01_000865 [Channa striata]|uniref:Uncharacterized protein n=1 Tax=Channa striata TaxID=64152 RepID=A0AA88LG05_CHASR|nr:hypothetical protein Q5P01_000865 [Channa striata]
MEFTTRFGLHSQTTRLEEDRTPRDGGGTPHTAHGLSLDQKDSGPERHRQAVFRPPHFPRPPAGRDSALGSSLFAAATEGILGSWLPTPGGGGSRAGPGTPARRAAAGDGTGPVVPRRWVPTPRLNPAHPQARVPAERPARCNAVSTETRGPPQPRPTRRARAGEAEREEGKPTGGGRRADKPAHRAHADDGHPRGLHLGDGEECLRLPQPREGGPPD